MVDESTTVMIRLKRVYKQQCQEHTVTLVYGARDEEHNEALVLKGILEGHLR